MTMMNFRQLITALLCLVAIAFSSASAAEKPNVLLILVDDLKPSFGAYGDDWVHSPNLDRLAGSGMRFDMAYCNQAVCAPSRNNLLVGSRSTSIGVYSLGDHFRGAVPDAVTMPQYFKKHGYHSAGIGKVFHVGHGNVNDEFSWSIPFHPDKVIDYVLPASTDGQLTKEQALFNNLPAKGLPRGAAWERADVDDGDYADGRIATEAIERLQAYKASDQPFFLATGFTKPHLPFCAPEKYWDLYEPAELPVTSIREYPKGAPAYAAKSELGELNQYKPIPEKLPLSDEIERTLIHGYYAALSYMDSQVGRVLDELDRLGLDDNTIVVLWGDHGYHLGDHGAWTKHTNYEQANRIPIVIRAPGVTSPGGSTKAIIETVDIFPTVAELAGLPAPTGPQPIDGKSVVSVLRDGSKHVKDHAYHCFPRGRRLGRAIRSEQYRLVEWKEFGAATDTAQYELYDYLSDPLETKNLAAVRPDVVSLLAAILATHPEAIAPGDGISRHGFGGAGVPRPIDRDSPLIANRSLTIFAEGKADNPQGVVIAQGGREHGYALHFIDGKPAFDVRVNGAVTRIAGPDPVRGTFCLEASLNEDQMTLSVDDVKVAAQRSPGWIPVQPKDALSVGLDALSAAGDYQSPNPFNGTVILTRVTTSGDSPPPSVAAAMDGETIRAGLESRDRALFVKSGWIRDPYIVLASDGYYYLTGTTPLPEDPRNRTEPYNTGLGRDSSVGWKMQAWRSHDLIDWEDLGAPFTLQDGIWFQQQPEQFDEVDQSQWRLWAPELHDVGGRWAIVHTSPSPVKGANLALTKDLNLRGPFEHPLGEKIGRRHDPSMFSDAGTWWLIWGATEIAPLKPDFSDFDATPTKIGPSGESKTMGHEGCLMQKIGDKYVLFGTGWSTGEMRRGSYNLYYATADQITGPYSERKFAGRFLGHGTPFQDQQGRWWCTAFYNANIPPLPAEGIQSKDLSETAQTINQQGVTIVPLDVRVLNDGEVYIRATDPDYALPGPDEAQEFE